MSRDSPAMSAGEAISCGEAAQRADRVIEPVQPLGDGGLGRDRIGLVREDLDGLGEVRDVCERAHGAEPVAQVAEAALDVGDHGMIAERLAVRLDARAERPDLLLERRERALGQRILERIGDLGEILAQRLGDLLGAHRREQLADFRRQHAHLFLDRRPCLLRHRILERVADRGEILAQRIGDLGGTGRRPQPIDLFGEAADLALDRSRGLRRHCIGDLASDVGDVVAQQIEMLGRRE